MARIICQVRSHTDRITIIWSDGSASFEPYHLTGEALVQFHNLAGQAKQRLSELTAQMEAGVGGVGLELARLGHQLYQTLFSGAARELQDWFASSTDQSAGGTLEILTDAPGTVPWNAVYDRQPEPGLFQGEGSQEAWRPFWGNKYNLTIGRRVNPWRAWPVLEDPEVLLVLDPGLRDSLPADQKQRLAELIESKDLTAVRSLEELSNALKSQSVDFLYVFCPVHDGGLMVDGRPLGSDDLAELLEVNRAGDYRLDPILFVNGCRAAGSSQAGDNLPRPGSQTGVWEPGAGNLDGVIVAEAPLPAAQANSFGLDLLAAFLYGKEPLGQALRRLRFQHGPAGLSYTASYPAGLRVSWQSDPIDEEEIEAIGPEPGLLPEAPYRPLAPYEREHRALFTGRDYDVARFASLLDTSSTKLVVLHGASGVGKSSFLRAGLVPYLEDDNLGYLVLRDRTPEESPLPEPDYPLLTVRATSDLAGQLADALCAFCAQPYTWTTPAGKSVTVDLPGILRGAVTGSAGRGATDTAIFEKHGSPSEAIRPAEEAEPSAIPSPGAAPPPLPPEETDTVSPELLWEALQEYPGLLGRLLDRLTEALPFELLLLIEQGDELFTQTRTAADRRRVRNALAMLTQAAAQSSRCKMVLSLRTEFFGRLMDHLPAEGASAPLREFYLPQLTEGQLLEAILLPTAAEPIPHASEIPAEKYGFQYEDGLGRTIVKDALQVSRQSGISAAPLIQIICASLGQAAKGRADPIVRAKDLKDIGGAEGALAAYVEDRIRSLPVLSSSRKALRELLQNLYVRQPEGTVTRDLVPAHQLAEAWKGHDPIQHTVERAAAENVRLLEVNRLLIGGKEGLYVSLSQDALAHWGVQMQEEKKRRQYGRSRIIDLLWLGIPLLFLVAAVTYYFSRTAGGGTTDLQDDPRLKKFIQSVEEQHKRLSDELAGTRWTAYRGHIALAENAWNSGDLVTMRQLLLSHQKMEKEPDPRGFEWYYLWRLAHQERQTLLGHSGPVLALARSPDGKTVASAGSDGLVRLWNVSDGKMRATFSGHKGPVYAVTFADDSKMLVSGGADGTVKAWEISGKDSDYASIDKEKASFAGLKGSVRAVAYTAAGQTLAAADEHGGILLWDLKSGKERTTLKGHQGAVHALAFPPDGKTLASGGADAAVLIWDSDTGKQLHKLSPGNGSVHALAFSPDGKSLASGSVEKKGALEVGVVRFWNPVKGEPSGDPVEQPAGVLALALDSNKSFWTGGKDRQIRGWDLGSSQPRVTIKGHLGWVGGLVVTDNGQTVISGSHDSTVRIWTPGSVEQPQVLQAHKGGVYSVALARGKQLLASGGRDGTVKIWDSDTGKLLTTLKDLPGDVDALAFGESGDVVRLAAGLATKKGEGEIRVWELATLKKDGSLDAKELTMLKGHTGPITSLAFGPDAKALVSGSTDQTILQWSVTDAKQVGKLTGTKGAVRSLSYLGNGEVVASGGDDALIRLWTVKQAKEILVLRGHTGPISSVQLIVEDKLYLVSGSHDQTARLWDVAASKEMVVYRGHPGPVPAAVFGRGNVFAAAADGSVSIWYELQPDVLLRLRGHTAAVLSLAVSADRALLASASADGTVRLWRAPLPPASKKAR